MVTRIERIRVRKKLMEEMAMLRKKRMMAQRRLRMAKARETRVRKKVLGTRR